MEARLIEFAVEHLLTSLNKEVVGKFLAALLRASVSGLKYVAAKTPTTIDDAVAARLGAVVEELVPVLTA